MEQQQKNVRLPHGGIQLVCYVYGGVVFWRPINMQNQVLFGFCPFSLRKQNKQMASSNLQKRQCDCRI
jgi:hypothetical protein